MTQIFSEMTAEDKMQFVSNMMPRCIGMIFAEIDKDAKVKLAKEMLEKMVAILEPIAKNKS